MTATSRIETNWLLIDDLDFWEEFTTKALKDNSTNTFFKQLDQAIDEKLSRTIEWLNSEEAQEYLKHETEYQKEVFEALEDEWDNILSGELNSVDQLLDKIYEQGKQKGYKDIREKIRYTDADRYALQFAKNYNFHLIQKLDNHVRSAVKKRIIQAEASGEHPYELASAIENIGVQPLPGSTLSARQRAVMIARTETARVQNTGIIQSYVNEGFTEVNILTAGDSSVCRLCLANAYEFNTDEIVLENRGEERVHTIKDMDSDNWVPLHPNCRCTYTVVWSTRGEVPENPKPVNLTSLKKYIETTIREPTFYAGDETFNVRDYGDVKIQLSSISNYKFDEIREYYDDLPLELKKGIDIIRASGKTVYEREEITLGYYDPVSKKKRITLYNQSKKDFKETLAHEATHLWEHKTYGDKNNEYSLSDDDRWRSAAAEDDKLYRRPQLDENGKPLRTKTGKIKYYQTIKIFVSDYATESYIEFHEKKETRNREYSEDLAESVPQFLYDYDDFKKKFQNRSKILEEMFL